VVARPGFADRVHAFVRSVPRGRVVTYGDVAEAVGHAGAARAVGRVMTTTPEGSKTPCHRVVRADGTVADGGAGALAARLRKEGVAVDTSGCVRDLARCRWP
jgi:methylated-DNA-protein-cysteine methyltransferase-like protein